MSNDCKSNVYAHQSCTIEVFRLEKKLQVYLVGLPECCNTWECFTYSFETETRGIIFFFFFLNTKKTLTRRFGSDARGDRELFFLALDCKFQISFRPSGHVYILLSSKAVHIMLCHRPTAMH